MTNSAILHLHNSLRQAKQRWAILFGAGASYDYGIPTMAEIAIILREMIKDQKPQHGVSVSTLELLGKLCPTDEKGAEWNIEDLLTRLYQLLETATSPHEGFAPVTTGIGDKEIDSASIRQASEELTQFMAAMCALTSHEHTNHGSGKVDYLTDFFLAMATFSTPMNRLLRVFTTNIDLCVEAALVRLSQRSRFDRRPDLVLIDGFESAIVPTFNMGCYSGATSAPGNRCAVYYWKLHGSVDWTYSQPLGQEGGNEQEEFSDQSIIVRQVNRELWDSLVKCGALNATAIPENRRIVIFPTPAKYSQTYTFPYMDLFEAFRRTLEEVELLICVGTSFPDQHIRSAVRSFVERDNTLLFVVDPETSPDTLESYFGQSRSVQPVIDIGFERFVQEFRSLEALTRREQVAEDER